MQTVPFIPEGTSAHIAAIVHAAINFNQQLSFGITEPLEELYVGYISNEHYVGDHDERYQVYKTKTEAQELYSTIAKVITDFENTHNTVVTYLSPINPQ